MFDYFEQILISFSDKIPVEIFAFFASIIEEIVAPIPSPAVMIVTGSIASARELSFEYLLVLVVLGATGKLVGSVIVYFISDKVEDILSGVLEKFFGVKHEDIESFGKILKGGWKDYLTLFLMRSFPFVPSSIISIGSGILKIPMKIFIISTFFGSLVRDFIYMYFGYAGVSVLGKIINKSESIESIIQIVLQVAVLVGLMVAYLKRKKSALNSVSE